MDRPPALGLRHVALWVADLDAAERFWVDLLGYRVEWRPDPDNVYLTLAGDNLALHRYRGDEREAFVARRAQHLDHVGLVVPRPADVDAWASHLEAHGVHPKAPPRTHRDGARSFYVDDPDGNTLQIIYHPPISDPASHLAS